MVPVAHLAYGTLHATVSEPAIGDNKALFQPIVAPIPSESGIGRTPSREDDTGGKSEHRERASGQH
jgi:hypothetical protein